MEQETNKQVEAQSRKKKKGMTSFRIFTTTLSILAVLWLTLFVYQTFGVGDSGVWIKDILILVLLLFLVFLAAVAVVGLFMLFRKIRGQL